MTRRLPTASIAVVLFALSTSAAAAFVPMRDVGEAFRSTKPKGRRFMKRGR